MRYDSEKHHRRSIRLQNYDYTMPGAYFVTICTRGRACLFGTVAGGEMQLNDAGRIIEQWWFELNHKFPTVETDEMVVMPSHFHGIVVIHVGADLRVGPLSKGASAGHQGAHVGAPLLQPGLVSGCAAGKLQSNHRAFQFGASMFEVLFSSTPRRQLLLHVFTRQTRARGIYFFWSFRNLSQHRNMIVFYFEEAA